MVARKPLKFAEGDKVIFKGSESSYYGHNSRADMFIGGLVTIVGTYNEGGPNAYLFGEFNEQFWFDEGCFDFFLPDMPDLPEFDASSSLDALLL